MRTCPKCHMSYIPDDARFCPNCGTQLTNGIWEIIDISEHPDLRMRSALGKVKTITIQNDTAFPLLCHVDGLHRYELPINGRISLEIEQSARVGIASAFSYVEMKLYANDVFNIVVVYNQNQTLLYKTK